MTASAAIDAAQRRRLLLDVRNVLAQQAQLGLTGLDLPREVLTTRTHPQPHPMVPQEALAGAKTDPPPQNLEEVRRHLGACRRCRLSESRTHIVFGTGNPKAQLMIVGEAPGRDEDLEGEPFVGAAGKLLDRMLAAMGLSRREVYIANILKCRPPKNRYPESDEIATCRPFVLQQVKAVGPQLVLVLGRCAAQALLESRAPLGQLRGRLTEFAGVQALPTFHPAYLLRNPADKALAWRDLQVAMRHLGLFSKG